MALTPSNYRRNSALNSMVFFVEGFQEELKRYPIGYSNKHGTLVINDVVYLGYEGYGIYKGTKNLKLEKLLQKNRPQHLNIQN